MKQRDAYSDGWEDGRTIGYVVGDDDGYKRASLTRMVREFHEAFGLAVDAEDKPELRVFRFKLIRDEWIELKEALFPYLYHDADKSLEAVAKEGADLVYVAIGTAVSLGIDFDEAFRRVHASNMSKREPDGTVRRDESGKVLKPSTYVAPDMTGVVK